MSTILLSNALKEKRNLLDSNNILYDQSISYNLQIKS